jgi:hypothetical protein
MDGCVITRLFASEIQPHQDCSRNVFPTIPKPERTACRILSRNQDESPRDPNTAQTADALLKQALANSFSLIRRCDRQMIDQPATAVVTAKHCANDRVPVNSDTAEAGVAQKILFYFLFGIAFRYFDAIDHSPHRERIAKVSDAKFPCGNRQWRRFFWLHYDEETRRRGESPSLTVGDRQLAARLNPRSDSNIRAPGE